MSLYDDMASIATEVLTELNQGTVTLTALTDTGIPLDPDAPWLGNTKTPVLHTLAATVKGVSKQFVNGTTIVDTDLEVTAAPFGIEPSMEAPVTIDGKSVALLKIVRIPAAGTVVAWKLIVRG